VGESLTDADAPVVSNLRVVEEILRASGATVERIALPAWKYGLSIFIPYVSFLWANMIRSEGVGYGHLGWIDVAEMAAFAESRGTLGDLLPYQIKCRMVAERYLHRTDPAIYGHLQNCRLILRDQIERQFALFDLLMTPTIPFVAPPLLPSSTSFSEISAATTDLLCFNTVQANLSGHPAITIPSGVDPAGLPTAVQFVAAAFNEGTALAAGRCVERALGDSRANAKLADSNDD
jgi:Asp-tRNA(Asn)/Glu-tRNA(Gln) amidotransferase A subunit family amidase